MAPGGYAVPRPPSASILHSSCARSTSCGALLLLLLLLNFCFVVRSAVVPPTRRVVLSLSVSACGHTARVSACVCVLCASHSSAGRPFPPPHTHTREGALQHVTLTSLSLLRFRTHFSSSALTRTDRCGSLPSNRPVQQSLHPPFLPPFSKRGSHAPTLSLSLTDRLPCSLTKQHIRWRW